MKLIIDSQIAQNFTIQIGYVIANDVDNSDKINSVLLEKCFKMEADLRGRFPSNENLREEESIKGWRDIYRSFGTKASKYLPTVEALARRVIKGNQVPVISNVVNSYLVPELKYLIPMGGYDLNKIVGNIRLRLSSGGEVFIGLDGIKSNTYNGEILYTDDEKVLTRRWNFRDSKDSMIDEETKNLILIAENPNGLHSTMKEMIQETSYNIEKYCGKANCKTGIVEVNSANSFDLS